MGDSLPELWDIDRVCAYLSCSKHLVYRLTRERRIRFVRVAKGLRFWAAAVATWLEVESVPARIVEPVPSRPRRGAISSGAGDPATARFDDLADRGRLYCARAPDRPAGRSMTRSASWSRHPHRCSVLQKEGCAASCSAPRPRDHGRVRATPIEPWVRTPPRAPDVQLGSDPAG